MNTQTSTRPSSILSTNRLRRENVRYAGTGGVSQNNRPLGFRPAFLDTLSGRIHLSRFANGQPAPMHLLDGLPDHLVLNDDGDGRRIRATVISGFVLDGRFYTREQAANYLVSQTRH